MTERPLQFVRPPYRPDIDGLRAIAVLAVVVFHTFPDYLSGGFFGVDVFFVISGYLITKIIFENIKNEKFGLIDFYSRRIRRIFPALTVVLLASYILGWFLLLSNEYEQLGKHVAAGAWFASNFVLKSEAGYFDSSAIYKPLLHLWSLGVEEQFYICWPIFLTIMCRYKVNLVLTTVAIAAVSFCINLSNNDAVATFYFPQFRFWEFLLGAVLVWGGAVHSRGDMEVSVEPGGAQDRPLLSGRPSQPSQHGVLNALAVVGLLLLAYGLLSLGDSGDSSGVFAGIPVLGTALLIVAGPTAFVNKYVLANKLLVAIGIISYPLYLWHWPLLAFARIAGDGDTNVMTRWVVIFFSLLLAWLTYKVVEMPIRFGSGSKFKVPILLGAMISLSALGFATYAGKGFDFRHVSQINDPLITGFDGGDEFNTINECGIADLNQKELFGKCMQDRRGNVRYALLGDSKAASLFSGLLRTSNSDGRWLIIGGIRGSVGPIPLVSADPSLASFQKVTQIALKAISENGNIKTVVIDVSIRALFQLNDSSQRANLVSYDDKYLSLLSRTRNYDRAFEGVSLALLPLIKSGKKIVFVVDNPALPSPQNCIARHTFLSYFSNTTESKINSACIISMDDFRDQIAIYTKLLMRLKGSQPESIDIFDPTEILCDARSRTCGPTLNGRALYQYTDHISDYAAGLIGTRLNAFVNHVPN
ncbi:MAG: acyltransferase family protein [Polaromonas sp.]